MSAEQAQAELNATDELVRKITGKYPIYARAPYGEVPENGDVDRQRFYIGWTVDPLDWMTEDKGPEYAKCIGKSRAGRYYFTA